MIDARSLALQGVGGAEITLATQGALYYSAIYTLSLVRRALVDIDIRTGGIDGQVRIAAMVRDWRTAIAAQELRRHCTMAETRFSGVTAQNRQSMVGHENRLASIHANKRSECIAKEVLMALASRGARQAPPASENRITAI